MPARHGIQLAFSYPVEAMICIASDPRISAPVRFILAVFQLVADIETNFGRAILDILKKQYPDQTIDANPGQVGHKLMAIARKELQYNPADAADAVQDFLAYISTGAATEEVETTDPDTGEVIKEERPRKEAKPWNFAKDFTTWKEALGAIYTNLRRRAISQSMKKFKKEKKTVETKEGPKVVETQKLKEKSTDQAFGKRPSEGGPAEGGEQRIPDLSEALDDKKAIKDFYTAIREFTPELKESLPYEQKVLWELIFEKNVGTFQSDIKANMAQATALRDHIQEDADDGYEDAKKILEKHGKRWSGFVGDTRKALLTSIQDYVEKYLTEEEFDLLWEEFYSDITPKKQSDIEKAKAGEKEDYQLGLDERKYARYKWIQKASPEELEKAKAEPLTKTELKHMETLAKRLKDAGKDPDKIEPLEPREKKQKKSEKEETESTAATTISSILAMAHRVAFGY